MSAQTQVPKLYKSVIEDVINNVREAFMDEGIDESVLSELKNIWQSKLTASKVMESDIPSAASVNDPMISGPYIALQQQHNNSGISRVPGYQAEKQQQQTITRTPAVPVSSVPMFTTMTNPVGELSDAASMAYSSLLQSQQGKGASSSSSGAVGGPGSRAQLHAAAAAAQPQYLFASPGSVGPVIIPHSQAVRLQQQQQLQQQQHQHGRVGQPGMRGSLPQVDGALDECRIAEEEEEVVEEEFPALDPNFSSLSLKRTLLSPVKSAASLPDSGSSPFASRSSFLAQNDFQTSTTQRGHSSSSTASVNSSTEIIAPGTYPIDSSLTASIPVLDAATTSVNPIVSSIATPFITCSSSSSSSSSPAELCLSNGESLRGKIIKKSSGKKRPVTGKPKKGDKIEIVFQVDGNNSSSDDDDDDDDDGDANEDDSSDRDPDDEDIPGVEDEPLNSGDDVSDNDPEELFDTENVVVCQYEKISRVRNKWRFYLKDGIMNIQGRDYVFLKASGEAEW